MDLNGRSRLQEYREAVEIGSYLGSRHGGRLRHHSMSGGMFEAWDEMFERARRARPAYRSLFAALQTLSGRDLRLRADQLARAFLDQGITFSYAGEERPFPLDLIPRDHRRRRVGRSSRRASRQRVRALEAFLADVYGPAEILADGVVPRRLVTTSRALPPGRRTASSPPNGVRVHVAGVDLDPRRGRATSGCWRTTSASRPASPT